MAALGTAMGGAGGGANCSGLRLRPSRGVVGVLSESCDVPAAEVGTKLRPCAGSGGGVTDAVAPAGAVELADGCCWLPTISSF